MAQIENKNIVKLDLSDQNICNLSDSLFEGLTSLKCLDLKNNQIQSFGSTFKPLMNLNELDLSSNAVLKINNNTFSHNKLLQVLNLNNNPLCKVFSNSFSKLKKLTTLNLNNTNIGFLSSSTFANNVQLTKLYIKSANLKISRGLFNSLSNVEILNLSDNNLTEIHPTTFDTLRNLRYLNLKRNRLTHLRNFLTKNDNLVTLVLSRNSTIFIDDTFFRSLFKLEYLSIHGCDTGLAIKAILFKFNKQLKTLSLSYVRHLDDKCLKYVTKLKYKTCYDINGSTGLIVAPILNFSNHLIYLDITNCLLNPKYLHTINYNKPNLVKLVLVNDIIEYLAANTFHNLNTLTNLTLDDNQIGGFENVIFSKSNVLRKLSLVNCQILRVGRNSFTNLNHLTDLNLSMNFFLYGFDVHLFRTLKSLLVLNLSNCNLRSLPDGIFYNTVSLKELYLHGNVIREVKCHNFQYCVQLKLITFWDYTILVDKDVYFLNPDTHFKLVPLF